MTLMRLIEWNMQIGYLFASWSLSISLCYEMFSVVIEKLHYATINVNGISIYNVFIGTMIQSSWHLIFPFQCAHIVKLGYINQIVLVS